MVKKVYFFSNSKIPSFSRDSNSDIRGALSNPFVKIMLDNKPTNETTYTIGYINAIKSYDFKVPQSRL